MVTHSVYANCHSRSLLLGSGHLGTSGTRSNGRPSRRWRWSQSKLVPMKWKPLGWSPVPLMRLVQWSQANLASRKRKPWRKAGRNPLAADANGHSQSLLQGNGHLEDKWSKVQWSPVPRTSWGHARQCPMIIRSGDGNGHSQSLLRGHGYLETRRARSNGHWFC